MLIQPMKFFYAYPGTPKYLGQIIESASEKRRGTNKSLHCWPENDICGRLLTDPIFEQIEACDGLIADITSLNFNVVFEAGYAIGRGKKVYYTVNSGSKTDSALIDEIGIFDNIGYETYQNSDDLSSLIGTMDESDPLFIDHPKNIKTPIYILEHRTRTEGLTRIISRTKKSRIRHQSFNPDESIRLSAFEAIQKVSESSGVIIPLASKRLNESNRHNIRAAFVAGLSIGMRRVTLIIQDYDGPAPLDVREVVRAYRHPDDINDFVANFADEVMEMIQSVESPPSSDLPPLTKLHIGDAMAENEMDALSSYYISTDEYLRVLQGDANVVVGRKGMGKTALFTQLRNAKRSDKRNVVVDLKPEGYQIIKLREQIAEYTTDGAKQHLFVSFWEYLLYMEIAYKLLEKDNTRRMHDHEISAVYNKLEEIYSRQESATQGDFSERLLVLSEHIRQRFQVKFGNPSTAIRFTNNDVTELVYAHALPEIKTAIFDYMKLKQDVWVLFDNLDKGWPPEGIDPIDALLLRCLIDATKKIQRDMRRNNIEFRSVVFVRNDVYELLMQNSADFGKEIQVSLDWSDPSMLSNLIHARITDQSHDEFSSIWGQYFSRLHKGEDSFSYLLERSIMRPRNLIKMIIHCRSFAINLRKNVIDSECIEKGLKVYSNDMIKEADEELSDIEPKARGLLYKFFGEQSRLGADQVSKIITEHCGAESVDSVTNYLLYFGFFGVEISGLEPKYIFDFHYNMKLVQAVITKNVGNFRYVLNPAFWPVLENTS